MSKVEKVIECSTKNVSCPVKPISQLAPISKPRETGWNTSHSSPDNFSEETHSSPDNCSEETHSSRSIRQKIANFTEVKNGVAKLEEEKKEKMNRLEKDLEILVQQTNEKKKQLESDIKELERLRLLMRNALPAINNPAEVKRELEDTEDAIEAVDDMKANELVWTAVVKKGTSSTEKKTPATKTGTSSTKTEAPRTMEISGSVHELIVASKKRGFRIPKGFLADFFSTVEMELELNSNVFAKFFPIYLNYRVLNQLLYLTRNDAYDRERVLEYIKYFGPPKWVNKPNGEGLHTLMDEYEASCSFYMTEQVEENLGYTRMSPEDFEKFEEYYNVGWISFLNLATGEVIPLDDVRPLFGKLL